MVDAKASTGEPVSEASSTSTNSLLDLSHPTRAGLRVSPLALGTMTFGPSTLGSQGWGADEETSRSIFLRYLESGGNFVATVNLSL